MHISVVLKEAVMQNQRGTNPRPVRRVAHAEWSASLREGWNVLSQAGYTWSQKSWSRLRKFARDSEWRRRPRLVASIASTFAVLVALTVWVFVMGSNEPPIPAVTGGIPTKNFLPTEPSRDAGEHIGWSASRRAEEDNRETTWSRSQPVPPSAVEQRPNGYERLGYSRDRCLICKAIRYDDGQFGYCANCEEGSRAAQSFDAAMQRGFATHPAIVERARQHGDMIERSAESGNGAIDALMGIRSVLPESERTEWDRNMDVLTRGPRH